MGYQRPVARRTQVNGHRRPASELCDIPCRARTMVPASRDHLRRPPRPAASGTATTGALLNGHGKPNAVAQPLELSDDTHLDHRRNAGGYARRPDPLPELMRMEWRKNNDTRAASWLLTAIALLTTGAAMVPLCLPHEMQQRWPATSP
jgi:hypothetical protein